MARILVVEDERDIADFIGRGLALKGHEVDIARDGEEALARARERPPEVVVLDLMLPGVDGIEVCRRLRTASDVPIIYEECTTAARGCVDCKRHLAASINSYLEPFRERRREYEARPSFIQEVLEDGAKKARVIAQKTIEEVYEKMGLA